MSQPDIPALQGAVSVDNIMPVFQGQVSAGPAQPTVFQNIGNWFNDHSAQIGNIALNTVSGLGAALSHLSTYTNAMNADSPSVNNQVISSGGLSPVSLQMQVPVVNRGQSSSAVDPYQRQLPMNPATLSSGLFQNIQTAPVPQFQSLQSAGANFSGIPHGFSASGVTTPSSLGGFPSPQAPIMGFGTPPSPGYQTSLVQPNPNQPNPNLVLPSIPQPMGLPPNPPGPGDPNNTAYSPYRQPLSTFLASPAFQTGWGQGVDQALNTWFTQGLAAFLQRAQASLQEYARVGQLFKAEAARKVQEEATAVKVKNYSPLRTVLSKHYPEPQTPPAREVLNSTGIRNYKFPTDAHLKKSSYPDVTSNQNIYVNQILKGLQNNPGSLGNFRTNGKWDLKGQVGIPGKNQWAIYKGELIQDTYLANNAYGQAMAAIGLTLNDSLAYAQHFTHLNTLTHNFFHNHKLKIENDQPEDQAAIESGWYDYVQHNPWPNWIKKPRYFLKK